MAFSLRYAHTRTHASTQMHAHNTAQHSNVTPRHPTPHTTHTLVLFMICDCNICMLLMFQRFCQLDKKYMEPFQNIFYEQFETIHRLETNKLRNVAKFFAHLLHTDAITWGVGAVHHLRNCCMSSSHPCPSPRRSGVLRMQKLKTPPGGSPGLSIDS